MAALGKQEPRDLAFIGHTLFPAQLQHRAPPSRYQEARSLLRRMLGLPIRVLTGLFMAPWPSFQSSQVRPIHPYSGGTFKIEIHVPEEYPFEPRRFQFLTKVYHPNIDDQGRICLDILKGPPKGSWNPAISIATMLLSLRVLLANPNPDDALLVDIASEFKENKRRYASPSADTPAQGPVGQPSDGSQTCQRIKEPSTIM
ncbi:MAG: ubiquitin-conjugating enzyme/RWD-like protein [Benniella sp.]|nr:MAG: ubiquitin-conjugating enzyme/RWD-like protein [Benniella sp.]